MFFKLVRSHDIPLIYFSHKKFKTRLLPLRYAQGRNDRMGVRNNKKEGRNDIAPTGEKDWRLKYDSEVNKRIGKFAPDLCVLAGYMLIVGKGLCRKYNMINLHPALPGGPTGSWQEVIWKLIESKADKAGAMMHLVTPELDRGPVISYCVFPIEGKPFDRYWQKGKEDMLFQLIRQHELAREFPLTIFTLQALSRGEVVIRDGEVVDARGKSIDGYDLSDRIDKVVKNKMEQKEARLK